MPPVPPTHRLIRNSTPSSFMIESEHGLTTTTEEAGPLRTLEAQIRSLQALVLGALMASMLLSVGVNIYFYRQVSMLSKELRAATRLVQEFDSSKRQLINTFATNLVVYARTHPDFVPILQRYGLSPAPPQNK